MADDAGFSFFDEAFFANRSREWPYELLDGENDADINSPDPSGNAGSNITVDFAAHHEQQGSNAAVSITEHFGNNSHRDEQDGGLNENCLTSSLYVFRGLSSAAFFPAFEEHDAAVPNTAVTALEDVDDIITDDLPVSVSEVSSSFLPPSPSSIPASISKDKRQTSQDDTISPQDSKPAVVDDSPLEPSTFSQDHDGTDVISHDGHVSGHTQASTIIRNTNNIFQSHISDVPRHIEEASNNNRMSPSTGFLDPALSVNDEIVEGTGMVLDEYHDNHLATQQPADEPAKADALAHLLDTNSGVTGTGGVGPSEDHTMIDNDGNEESGESDVMMIDQDDGSIGIYTQTDHSAFITVAAAASHSDIAMNQDNHSTNMNNEPHQHDESASPQGHDAEDVVLPDVDQEDSQEEDDEHEIPDIIDVITSLFAALIVTGNISTPSPDPFPTGLRLPIIPTVQCKVSRVINGIRQRCPCRV